jgi:MFS family permease
MRRQIAAIAAILFSTLIFLMGNGLLGTLTPVRGHMAGFSDLVIGVIGSAYFAGFVIGCYAGPPLLRRIGHTRAFAVAAGIAATSALLQPLAVEEIAWVLARGLFGFSAANLYMVIESWLNDRATNETRGRIFSSYLTVNFGGLMLGQALFMTGRAENFVLFNLAAMFYALCLIPVSLTRLPQPAAPEALHLRPLRIFRIAPVGVAGCLTVGFANGAIWTLAPVYAAGHGLHRSWLALFMICFTFGGALMQLPLGRLSDRMDRRWIIVGVSVSAALSGLALAWFGGMNRQTALALAALMGVTALPLYGLSVAHANDRLPRADFVEASATLLLLNALASVVGPTFAAFVMARTGSAALFVVTAAAHGAFALFAIIRIRIKEAPPDETREPYAPLPAHASPGALELDPRGPEQTDQQAAG